MKMPYGILDDLEIYELLWLIEGHDVAKKDFYEMASYSVKNAMVSVLNGKDIKMFGDQKQEEQKITREDRQEDIAYLKNTFDEL